MANVIDPRIALLNSIADTVPPDYYRADGTELRFYAYAWFHGQTCINVGKGTGPRFLEFFVNPDYNTLAAHDYVRQHHGELEVFFVNAAITETAAFAVEYQLIEYFRRQSENGTLYNVLPGYWPPCPSGEALHHLRGMAEQAVIPPTAKPLSRSGYWRDCKHFIPDFLPNATLRLLKNVWREGVAGDKLYKRVLIFSATVGGALRLAEQEKIPKKRQQSCQNEIAQATQVLENIGAGEGNRTLVISLEGCCCTISSPFFTLHEKPVLAGTSRLVYGCEWSRDFHANTRGNVTPASPRRSSCRADKEPHRVVRSSREAAGARPRRILRRSISRACAARNG